MINRSCIITVNGNTASIDSNVFLYKNDKNIQLAFSIINSKYMYDNDDSNNLISSMQAAYAQVKFKKDDSEDIEIEFDVQATKNGAVILTIREELTDEDTELGDYTIQIRLLDSNKNSVITLPPVQSCIHILKPLFEKLGSDTNIVNKAEVNKAVATYSVALSATNEDGTFNKKTWVEGDKITTGELNRMEDGINNVSTQYKDIANLSLTKHTDGKVYIKKQDGTLIGTGVEVGSDADLSKMTMSLSGNTLKLLNNGKQIATVDLPNNTTEMPDNIVLFEDDGNANDIIIAGNIKITDTNNNFTATDVEGALSELFQSASNGKTLIANAVTGKGVATNASDSFATMATNIKNISTGGTGITPTGTKEITQNGTYDVTNYASANVNVANTSTPSILPAVGTFEVSKTIYEESPAQIVIEHGLGRTPTKVVTFPLNTSSTLKVQLGFYGDSTVNLGYRSEANGLKCETAGISTTSKYVRVDENKIYLSPLPWVNTKAGTYCWIAI